ncbi:MAG: prepilin-type N-terminal cleavage/methylation domain-containing protein [Candidatus Omnitrophica bacterium]|nr:prepilin-type N-terminal cleavage/methylation domain-containing protein [Candidatus Omnitrophota bacterium]MDE2223095.1 prepilin-type N-terminal cleavage/methylation domain-containing protein [Candidatus Omnitrophota bacterium]
MPKMEPGGTLFRKGFTLLEIIVVLVIITILTAVAIPNYTNFLDQGAANAAQNNLIAIYNAQKDYYLKNGYYCDNAGSSTGKCTSLASINTNLSLNIQDSYFTYQCSDVIGWWYSPWDMSLTRGFRCYASSSFTVSYGNHRGNVKEGIDFSYPIVFSGGSGTLNPRCEPAGSPYCPN